MNEIEIPGSSYVYSRSQQATLDEIARRVSDLRSGGSLTPEMLHKIRKYFRIKNIYHSNAIEGNKLGLGETRQVVEMGMTLTGKSLKDQAEAKNLGQATDYLEDLVSNPANPIMERDIREIHHLVLKGIDDDNAGKYRTVPVKISGSEFSPPGPESIAAEMQEVGSWLAEATVPGKKFPFASADGILAGAVAHTWFVHVHPFIDGNGRVARLLMNLVLMRFGVPIAIISRDDRLRYYDALETAQASDLSSFVALLCECVHESLEEYEDAAKEQKGQEQWARSLAERFEAQEAARLRNEHEVWRSAMDLLMGYMRQTAGMISGSASAARICFREFGHLEVEKYMRLKSGQSAKRTWFFRVDFRSGERTARYLFFFASPSHALRKEECGVTLSIVREEPPGSYFYERLDDIDAPNVPGMREVGYSARSERFVSRHVGDKIKRAKIEKIGREFYEDVIKKHFSS